MVTVSYAHFHVWLFLSISLFSITLANLGLIAKAIICSLQVATQWPVYFMNVSIPIMFTKYFLSKLFIFGVKYIQYLRFGGTRNSETSLNSHTGI